MHGCNRPDIDRRCQLSELEVWTQVALHCFRKYKIIVNIYQRKSTKSGTNEGIHEKSKYVEDNMC